MSNGNFLNSLLGITSSNPAVTKAAVTKARAESTEKFQQALEQVRPDVAARKPVARKESPVTEPSARPAPKPVTQQRDERPEALKADAAPKTREDTPATTNAPAKGTLNNSSASTQDTGVDKKVVDNQNEGQSAESQGQTLAAEDQTLEVQDQIEGLVLADPALVISDGPEELVVLPEQLAVTANTQSGISDDPANEDDIGLSLASAAEAVLDPSLLVVQPKVASLGAEVAVDAEGDEPALLLASNPAVLGKIASAPSITGSDADSAAGQIPTGIQAGKLTDELALASAGAEKEVAADASADAEENPDFLLLNSKSTLNKLAETAMMAPSLDKAHTAADVAKPAAISAAVETLTRLSEAQSPAARAFVAQTGVPVTVGTPQWSQAVGDKVLWLAAQNVSAAEIRLDPPELGPMQVKVSVNQDQASVTFTSPHPAVREALDQQLNRLREMFSEQGLNLVNVDVSDKSFAQQERDKQTSAGSKANGVADEEELAPVALSQAVSMRLVDHYA